MKEKGRRLLWIGCVFIAVFAIWTLLIQKVDVQPLGVNGTNIGFATINCWFHKLTGVHMAIYIITDWLGLVPIFICMIFGAIGCTQLIKRRSLLKCHASNYSSHLRQIYRRLNSTAPLHYLSLRAVFYGTFFSVLLTILSDSLIVIFATENKKRKNSPDQSSFFLSTPSAVSRFLAGSMS